MGKLIVCVMIAAIVLLFPIFLTVDLFTDIKNNKIFISPRLFSLIPLFGGYITIQKEGLYFHFSEQKAKCFLFSEMKEDKNGKEFAKAFSVLGVRSTLEIGWSEDLLLPVLGGGILQVLSAVLFSVLKNKKPFVKIENGILLSRGKSGARVALHVVSACCLLTLIIAFCKIIWEDWIEWQTKKNTRQLKI